MDHLQTEARNPASTRLDELMSVELVDLMNREDSTVAAAVGSQRREIARAIDAAADRLARGGRLIYVGAGTSGRLGVLDATECPPTFQTPPGQVIGLIAGGQIALTQAVEGAEDRPELAEQDLAELNLSPKDLLVGIATSGRTPYVIGAVRYARKVGAFTVGVACNPDSDLEPEVELPILPVVGPEVLSGSTRLKAGTATKMVLNMLSTGAMVRLGKTFGNLMVDLRATNNKLKARSNRIVRMLTGLDVAAADVLLGKCNGEVKTAVVARLCDVSPEAAREKLKAAGGRVGEAVGPRLPAGGASAARPHRPDLVIGIDGGGSHTLALLADAATGKVIARGTAGPSNIQSVGVEAAVAELDAAIDKAFAAANVARSRVGAASLGLAGIDRKEGFDVIYGWAARAGLADEVSAANDATLLLAAGTPEGWGLAIVCGTGSIAFVRSPSGDIGRAGGWGYLLGDEGSAFQIVVQSLRAACRAVDQCGPQTVMVDNFVEKMGLPGPPDLIPAVYRGAWDRAALASLAPLVLQAAAEGDEVAVRVVSKQAEELARTAAAAVTNNGMPTSLPLALTGGVVLRSELYRSKFLAALRGFGVNPNPVTPVEDPALGAIVMARRLIGKLA
jgi:N-acetylmuramic acid 6-phosphate etherase